MITTNAGAGAPTTTAAPVAELDTATSWAFGWPPGDGNWSHTALTCPLEALKRRRAGGPAAMKFTGAARCGFATADRVWDATATLWKCAIEVAERTMADLKLSRRKAGPAWKGLGLKRRWLAAGMHGGGLEAMRLAGEAELWAGEARNLHTWTKGEHHAISAVRWACQTAHWVNPLPVIEHAHIAGCDVSWVALWLAAELETASQNAPAAPGQGKGIVLEPWKLDELGM